MVINIRYSTFLYILFLQLILAACNTGDSAEERSEANKSEKNIETVDGSVKKLLNIVTDKNGRIDDSTLLPYFQYVDNYYQKNDYASMWSKESKWNPLTDSLIHLIKNAELFGLFPNDYNYKRIASLKKILDQDSIKRLDPNIWAKSELLMTDAFMHIVKDLKVGRLHSDSTTLNPDSILSGNFYEENLKTLFAKNQFSEIINSIQPKQKGYWELINGIENFRDSMDRKVYTYVTYPYKSKDSTDSVKFVKVLQKRLKESNCIDFTNPLPDTTELKNAVRKYQKLKGVKQDGIVSAAVVKMLNNTDLEKFKRIAITLDRYKQLPAKMPEKYIWVNLPGFYLQVWDSDTVAIQSKIICGKPATRTPLLTSYITDMVTYPTWTVPTSIIVKQYLPKLKTNPNYLAKLGLKLVDKNGETVNGSGVNWHKYTKGIPYKVMQNSGDDNALGVMKFNFNNPFAVYLHDTNQRYLFKNPSRAYSHGCVRVQEWEKLANFIVQNDSVHLLNGEKLKYNYDSIKSLIAEKQRKRIDVKNKIPLYIRYFSCEGKNGKIKFYDDMYGEDKAMREKYFKN
jgi:L,D-transpeptidase YcbB